MCLERTSLSRLHACEAHKKKPLKEVFFIPQGFLSQNNHRHLIQILWVTGYVYIPEVWIKKEVGGGDRENAIS